MGKSKTLRVDSKRYGAGVVRNAMLLDDLIEKHNRLVTAFLGDKLARIETVDPLAIKDPSVSELKFGDTVHVRGSRPTCIFTIDGIGEIGLVRTYFYYDTDDVIKRAFGGDLELVKRG